MILGRTHTRPTPINTNFLYFLLNIMGRRRKRRHWIRDARCGRFAMGALIRIDYVACAPELGFSQLVCRGASTARPLCTPVQVPRFRSCSSLAHSLHNASMHRSRRGHNFTQRCASARALSLFPPRRTAPPSHRTCVVSLHHARSNTRCCRRLALPLSANTPRTRTHAARRP